MCICMLLHQACTVQWAVYPNHTPSLSLIIHSLWKAETKKMLKVLLICRNNGEREIFLAKYKMTWFLEALSNNLGVICPWSSLSPFVLDFSLLSLFVVPSSLFCFPLHVIYILFVPFSGPSPTNGTFILSWFLWLLHVIYSHLRIWS